jgi:hypothetical protein
MDLLARLFAIGRLGRPPKDQTAGRFRPPASVQRSQLGLSAVDLPSGVVTVRGGEVRCLLTLSGFPLHSRSGAEARAFLARFAQALNALPPEAAWLVRSRPGGGPPPERPRPAGTARAAVGARTPGAARAPLARLAADQLAHARRLAAEGTTRQTASYVVLRERRGNVRALLQHAAAAAGHLRAAGLAAELVTDRQLAHALAASWRPSTEHVWLGFTWPGGGEATLVYDEGNGATVRHGPKGPTR